MPTHNPEFLDTFENPNQDIDAVIQIRIPEFTCLCPKTGQPDFATIYLEYIACKVCVELKSLKLYIGSFRNIGAFHEAVGGEILSDLVGLLDPRYLRLRLVFNVRGGIYTTIILDHTKASWKPTTTFNPDLIREF